MLSIYEVKLGARVIVSGRGEPIDGVVVGRIVNGVAEGYVTPVSTWDCAARNGRNMIEVASALPADVSPGKSYTTSRTIFLDNVELAD